MNTVVVDASVVVKWVFPEAPRETDVNEAVGLLHAIRSGQLGVLQPPHWLAEVAAVATRLDPTVAPEAVGLLHAMELPVLDELDVYTRACALARELRQHVFGALYHAVALCRTETVLVTADERYYRKAHRLGRVVRLKEWGR